MGSARRAPVRIAVLGAGMASAPHFASLADLASGPSPEVEVAWVWGRDPARLAATAARVAWPRSARIGTDLDTVLGDDSVDAVLVLTPPEARDGGGVLMTQAIHTLDLLLQYTGKPVEAHAYALTSQLHRMECEDTVVAILRFAGGAVASVDATTAAWPGYPECITLNGTLGSATLQAGVLTVQLADGQRLQAGQAQGGGGADPMAFDPAAHRSLLQDFVRSIRGGHAPAVSGRSALAVHRLIDKLMASAGREKASQVS